MILIIPYGCHNGEWYCGYSVFNGSSESKVEFMLYDSGGNLKLSKILEMPTMSQCIIKGEEIERYVDKQDYGRHAVILKGALGIEITQVMTNRISRMFNVQQGCEFDGPIRNLAK